MVICPVSAAWPDTLRRTQRWGRGAASGDPTEAPLRGRSGPDETQGHRALVDREDRPHGPQAARVVGHAPSAHEAERSEPFDDRQAAEDWLALAWEDLLDRGFTEVGLVDLESGEVVYRMGLGPAS